MLDIVCIGQSSVNFVINIRSLPDRDSASVEENFAIGSPVGIIKVHLGILGERGLYWDWYYVQYEDINPYVQNIESRGWIRRDVMGSIANCGDIPRYDDNGSEIPPPIYDYRLPPPPENAIWYDSTWVMLDNNGTPQISATNPPIIDGDECKAAPASTAEALSSYRACAKIVYYIYYEILSKIDTGQSLMLSRLIGAIYQNELRFQNDNSYLEFAQQAIKANYWITCANNSFLLLCRDDETKIHEINPIELVGGYLASMEAWYGKAFELLRWYWMLEQNNNLNFTSIAELENLMQNDRWGLNGLNTLKLLINPLFENILAGELVLQNNNYGATDPWWWGNYGFGSETYNNILQNGHPNIVYCVIVRDFDDIGTNTGLVDDSDFWTDYIFVFINITSIGPTSNYDKNIRPDWLPENDTKIPTISYGEC